MSKSISNKTAPRKGRQWARTSVRYGWRKRRILAIKWAIEAQRRLAVELGVKV